MKDILYGLNSQQKLAVEHIDGPLLILAGAGSGKTKTITTRLAYLIDFIGIPPDMTLTLTFTNKAAVEMRDRALNMLSNVSQPPLLCTFHKFGLFFLRFYIMCLNRKADFRLVDNEDRKRIVNNLTKELNANSVLNTISMMKNAMIYPNDAIASANDKLSKQISAIYKEYSNFLLENNMLDFDDLLLLSYKILDENKDVCNEVSDKYKYIMVDEYQDTNKLQYKLLLKLCTNHKNIVVVGDDDQSIYGFRGADINNILDFSDSFKSSKMVKLEKNYRSTNQILDAANNLISHNENRLGKTLVSVKGDGKEVEVIQSQTEVEEVQNIIKIIKRLVSNGACYSDMAILFRLNALSRAIETGLNKENIPCKLIGTLRFYERAEIKDIISYFRLIADINDDFSLLRIINKPKRGIGKVTQEKLLMFVKERNISIYRALTDYGNNLPISQNNIIALRELFELILDLKEILNISIMRFIDEFKTRVKILQSYEMDNVDREANVDEFYGYFRDYVINNPDSSLDDFLNDLSLDGDANDSYNSVSCMSVHSAKGLEFNYVFIVGFEDGFFPLLSNNTTIEEERRLGYVAFSRAKDELYVSYVKSRFYRGKREIIRKSRFLLESNLETNVKSNKEFSCNDLVMHKIFGIGKVIGINKVNERVVLKINFGGIIRDVGSSFITKVVD